MSAVQEDRAKNEGATDEGDVAVEVEPDGATSSKEERQCTDYCCLACDSEYAWYNIKGKGCFWVFILLLLYLIVGLIFLPCICLYFVCTKLYETRGPFR